MVVAQVEVTEAREAAQLGRQAGGGEGVVAQVELPQAGAQAGQGLRAGRRREEGGVGPGCGMLRWEVEACGLAGGADGGCRGWQRVVGVETAVWAKPWGGLWGRGKGRARGDVEVEQRAAGGGRGP